MPEKCQVKNPKIYNKLRNKGYSKEKAARISNAVKRGGKKKPGSK